MMFDIGDKVYYNSIIIGPREATIKAREYGYLNDNIPGTWNTVEIYVIEFKKPLIRKLKKVKIKSNRGKLMKVGELNG